MKTAKSETVFRLYVGDEDKLYYVTDGGVVFVITMSRLADDYEQDQPFPVESVAGLPIDRWQFSIEKDCPNTRAVREWIAAIDTHLAAMAAEMAELMAIRPPPRSAPPNTAPSATPNATEPERPAQAA